MVEFADEVVGNEKDDAGGVGAGAGTIDIVVVVLLGEVVDGGAEGGDLRAEGGVAVGLSVLLLLGDGDLGIVAGAGVVVAGGSGGGGLVLGEDRLAVENGERDGQEDVGELAHFRMLRRQN